MEIPNILIRQIQNGNVILFLGAGATKGAIHPEGKDSPSGKELSNLIAEHFLGSEYTEDDLYKDFVFGRVIETNSSVLVEIFNKVGNAYTEINDIIGSGIMFSPLQIFWDGIIKKRWKKIGQTENYNKYKDSNYANLKMVFGVPENFRLREFATAKETPITCEEMERNQYSYSTVWFPIDLENKIIETLAKAKHIDCP